MILRAWHTCAMMCYTYAKIGFMRCGTYILSTQITSVITETNVRLLCFTAVVLSEILTTFAEYFV
jgi:hypothetical protein